VIIWRSPITAPALAIVGAMMMQNVARVDWKDYTESIPAFLIIIGVPLSYSIADGLTLGFISYAIIKAFSGRGREISWLTYILVIVLVLYFVFVRSRMS
jgi:AGZA family xanthine/uracil permease-like MFS transporter